MSILRMILRTIIRIIIKVISYIWTLLLNLDLKKFSAVANLSVGEDSLTFIILLNVNQNF